LNLLNEDLATRVVLGLGNMPTEEESIAAAIAVSMVSASNKEQEDEAEARARAGLNAKGYTVGQDDPKKDYDGECLLRAVSPEGAGQAQTPPQQKPLAQTPPPRSSLLQLGGSDPPPSNSRVLSCPPPLEANCSRPRWSVTFHLPHGHGRI
jgi:hypothetical protein